MEKHNNNDPREIREIDEIMFGIYSAEEIMKLAVCKVDSSKLCSTDKNTGYGTVYDPRLGTIDNGVLCMTCSSNAWVCPGHFGYIQLNECIIHPLHYKRVVDFLRCFCTKCFKLLITADQIHLNNFNRLLGVKRFNKILEKLEKIDMCTNCSQPQPDIKYTATDNSISMIYKQKDKDKSRISIVLPVDEIKNIFDNISVDDVKLLGFNPDLMQPKNLILTVFPVIPTCFVENTLVLTDNGYKYIQDVEKNDKLYTHEGNFQKINDFQTKIYTGEMINIKTSYHPNIISCTPEHPFYVKQIDIVSGYKSVNGKPQYYKEKKIGEAEWINAGDLNSNHFIGMKRNTKNIIPEFNLEKNVLKILSNHDEWVLFGYYVGDGWIDLNRKGRFYLSLHDKDTEFISKLLNSLNISFYIKKEDHDTIEESDEESDEEDKCKSFECQNIILWNIFKEFGHLAHNKKIPSWVQDAPKEYIESFLDGYCEADGYNHSRNQIQLKTVSTDLAFSVQLLYMKLGKLAGIYYGKKSKPSKKRDHRPYNTSIIKERTKDLNIYHIEDDYIWFKITKNKKSFVNDIKVYNFEVDKDNSYCVENLISHNCCRPYIISESNICDDDLTIQLVEIIKANNHLKVEDGVPISDTKRQKYIQSLKFRIATFYNNSCLAPDTPVLMWDGSNKRADEIEVGDELVGDDGEKRNVLYTCSGNDDMYEISQNKGDTYIVNKEHYLTLEYSDHKKISWIKPNENYPEGAYWIKWFDSNVNIIKKKIEPVLNNLTKDKTLEIITEFSRTIKNNNIFDIKIVDYLNMPDSYKQFLKGIKLGKSLNWDYKNISIDPYLLGLWLCDTNENVINFRYHECQTSKTEKYLQENYYSINNCDKSFKNEIDKYKLSDSKYIPDDFLYTDTDTRLKVLAGIIDSDGYTNEDNTSIVISQCETRKNFINQIHFLTKTLGFYSDIKEIFKTINNKKYRGFSVYISGNVSIIPSLLKHKICKNILLNANSSNFEVKYIGKGSYNGFGVDSNHRFLLGDFTITHNSGKAKHSTNGRAIKGLKERLTGKEGLIRTNLMGKRCLFLGTKVLLWDGKIKNVEDIKIGDTLIGNDGEKRKVLKLFNGTDQMYKVKQGTGNDYVVNSEHTLTFKYNDNKKLYWKESIESWYVEWFDKITMKKKSKKLKPTRNRSKEEAYNEMKEFIDNLDTNNTINIDVKDYLKLSDKTKKLLYGYKIEKAVNWDHKEVEIDPYILGMWLGDGTKHGRTFTSVDPELVEYWRNWAGKNDMNLNLYLDGTNFHYGISKKTKGTQKTVFKQKLAKYGLVNNKFIPKDYMINSKEVRLALLAGLIDTDGSVEQEGVTIRISQCIEHKAIIDGARFIADSLGFQTSIKDKKTSWTHKGIRNTGTALVLIISGYGIEDIPTLLARKKCRPPKITGNNWTPVTVEPYKVGEFYGFEIDGNNLFVLSDFTVLHNCEQSGRTVIGPDPTLRMGQLAVPPEIASNLTVPVHVTDYNLEMLTKIVNEGKANFVIKKDNGVRINLEHKLFFRGTILEHGDIVIRTDPHTGEKSEITINNGKDTLIPGDMLKRNGEFIKDIKYPEKRLYHLNVGDIVERQLQNGDILLLNRQPTLHEGSMMAQEVVIRKGKTLRFNLSIAKSYNADEKCHF